MLRHPRYWPSWALIGLIWLLGLLPLPVLFALGQGLGFLLFLIGGRRRQVALINLRCCFPQLSERERKRMARAHFGYLGVAALAQGICWSASRERVKQLLRMEGFETVARLSAEGRPYILLVPHFLGLELASVVYGAVAEPGIYMYQRIRNSVVDWQVKRGRTRFGNRPLERHEDLRGLVRALKRGTPFFYMPDQDAGKRRGVFAEFCGQPAATVATLGRIARLANAVVVPVYARFLPRGQGLELRFSDPIAGLTGTDPIADATRMNQVIEAEIRRAPEQYFWVHRRFKTRPPGEPPLYPASSRRHARRNSR